MENRVVCNTDLLDSLLKGVVWMDLLFFFDYYIRMEYRRYKHLSGEVPNARITMWDLFGNSLYIVFWPYQVGFASCIDHLKVLKRFQFYRTQSVIITK